MYTITMYMHIHYAHSNHQVGGTYAKPMVLPPEVAIGAFGKVQVRQRV